MPLVSAINLVRAVLKHYHYGVFLVLATLLHTRTPHRHTRHRYADDTLWLFAQ